MTNAANSEVTSQKVSREQGEVLDIKLGATLLMELFGTGKRFRSTFIGMEKGRYIIVRMPQSIEIRQLLKQDMEVTIRYLHPGGKVFGFRCHILFLESRPYPLIFLSHPKTVEVLSLRKHERVDCFLPVAIFHSGNELSGIIVNISAGGLKLILETQAPHATDIKTDSEVLCKFNLFFSETETVTKGQVRNIEKDSQKIALGIQFHEASGDIQKSIQNYVKNIKDFLDTPVRNNS